MKIISVDYNCIFDQNGQVVDLARPALKAIKKFNGIIDIQKPNGMTISELTKKLDYNLIPNDGVNMHHVVKNMIGVQRYEYIRVSKVIDIDWDIVIAYIEDREITQEFHYLCRHEPNFKSREELQNMESAKHSH